MNKLKILLIVLWIHMFTGCTAINEGRITAPKEAVETTVIATISPSLTRMVDPVTPTPQNTPTAEKPTDQIFSNPTPISGKKVVQRCISISEWNPRTNPIEGFLITDTYLLEDINADHKGRIVDLSTGETKAMTAEPPLYGAAISPDRKRYFTIVQGTSDVEDRLLIFNLDGNVIRESKWDKSWGTMAEWLDDNWIIAFPPSPYPDLTAMENYVYGRAILINPYTDQVKKFDPEFQENLNFAKLIIAYNPSMTYALYYSHGYSLFDITTKKDLAFVDKGGLSFSPRWNSSGTKIYFDVDSLDSNSQDLYTLDITGKLSRLTRLGDAYKTKYISLAAIEISPDETKIALEYSVIDKDKEYPNPMLGIYDASTNQVTDTCISPMRGDFVWSPDGRKLAITLPVEKNYLFHPRPIKAYSVIIDVETWKGWRISEDEAVVGWMIK